MATASGTPPVNGVVDGVSTLVGGKLFEEYGKLASATGGAVSTGGMTVYQSMAANGRVQYVGITNDVMRRGR